jgi:hypothetical protein
MFQALNRRSFAATMLTLGAVPALAVEQAVKLFTIVTDKDETVVALTEEDAALAADAAAISKALTDRGSLTVWHYAVRKASDGELEQAPREKIGVRAQGVLRVEAYRTPLRVVAPAR